jgi:hypothetical protein
MSSNDEAEASIGATIEENSEAPSHDAASTSGIEEPETVDPPDEVPVPPAHDPLGFLSGPSSPEFDMDKDHHPFLDETELLFQGGTCQSVLEGRNRVDGEVS